MSTQPRILTTHVGSLPRPQAVVDVVLAQEKGEPVDMAGFDAVVGEAVRDVVVKQRDAGVDVVSDGDMSKFTYVTYLIHRLSGFEQRPQPRHFPADVADFPSFQARWEKSGAAVSDTPMCVGPVTYADRKPLEDDLRRFRTALDAAGVTTGFLTAPSPGVIAQFQPDQFYGSHETYLFAIAEAMKTEYEAIVAAGFTLQIDAPDLAMGRHSFYRGVDDDAFVAAVDLHVRALNHAVEGIPADKMRMHLCWGNYEGPHTRDIALEKIVAGVLKAKPAGLQFEAANPRHAHEWTVWRKVDIPAGKYLIPGTLESTTNFVEHPLLVAERLGHFVEVLGVDRVMAGSDCGFGTRATSGVVDPGVCWAKFAAMAQGARIATERAREPASA
jgi:5-methyltetrahydropteroyltriglutamate--homocysteine methyltransferase